MQVGSLKFFSFNSNELALLMYDYHHYFKQMDQIGWLDVMLVLVKGQNEYS